MNLELRRGEPKLGGVGQECRETCLFGVERSVGRQAVLCFASGGAVRGRLRSDFVAAVPAVRDER